MCRHLRIFQGLSWSLWQPWQVWMLKARSDAAANGLSLAGREPLVKTVPARLGQWPTSVLVSLMNRIYSVWWENHFCPKEEIKIYTWQNNCFIFYTILYYFLAIFYYKCWCYYNNFHLKNQTQLGKWPDRPVSMKHLPCIVWYILRQHALPCLTLWDPLSDGSLSGSLSMLHTVCSKDIGR